MEEQLQRIKNWLGKGSINIFGLPMSGKDTVGKRLATDLGAKFLSSGDIIRATEASENSHLTDNGALIPTNKFYDIVLPYFGHKDLSGSALILSSIGRWSGEETEVLSAAENGGHPIKVVLALTISEDEVRLRWQKARELNDRGERLDDLDPEVFNVRIAEYHEKTLPVLDSYRNRGLLLEIPGEGSRSEVYERVIKKLYEHIMRESS